MKKTITLITLIIMLTNLSFASFSNKDVGTKGMQFLKIGVGAKSEAMGGTGAASIIDVNSMYWNPAGLNYIKSKEASFMHCIWFEDITYDQIAYAHPLKKGVVGVMVNMLSMTELEKIDNKGNVLNETFKPSDVAFTLGYARKIKKIKLGMNFKYITSKLDTETASSFAIDLGIHKKVFKNKVNLGFAIQNLGTKIKYIKEEESLPLNIKIGGAYVRKLYKGKMLLALDINAPVDESVKVNFGFEYKHKMKNDLAISPRLGFRTDKNDLIEGSNMISGGFGLDCKSCNIDYAWSPYGELGSTHRISLKVKVDKMFKKRKKKDKKDKLKVKKVKAHSEKKLQKFVYLIKIHNQHYLLL